MSTKTYLVLVAVVIVIASFMASLYYYYGQNPSGDPNTGESLYTARCSGCHGPLESSNKIGVSASEIQNAINTVGPMSNLSDLTAAEIQAIADALSKP